MRRTVIVPDGAGGYITQTFEWHVEDGDPASEAVQQALVETGLTAFQNNRTYLALGAPTAAQAAAQVAALTRQLNGILRLIFHIYDAAT